jgi:hypothetical protein
MSEDFKKLDHFMRQHVPAAKAPSTDLVLNKSRKGPMLSLAGLGLASILTVVLVTRPDVQRQQSAILLLDVMSWDYTADELPEEASDAFALLGE